MLTVQELIDKLNAVEDKSAPVILSYVNVTWSGGCETCGYGASKSTDERSSEASEVYDFSSRVVIEAKEGD